MLSSPSSQKAEKEGQLPTCLSQEEQLASLATLHRLICVCLEFSGRSLEVGINVCKHWAWSVASRVLDTTTQLKATSLAKDTRLWVLKTASQPSHGNGRLQGSSSLSSSSNSSSRSPPSPSSVSHSQTSTAHGYGKKVPSTAGTATPMKSSTPMPTTNPSTRLYHGVNCTVKPLLPSLPHHTLQPPNPLTTH